MTNNKITKVTLGKGFTFDCSTKELKENERFIELNRAEREILCYLIQHANSVVKKDQLLSVGWTRKEITTTSLFQTIRNLRIKLKEDEIGQIIEMVPRLGYQIKVDHFSTSSVQNTIESSKKTHKKKRYIIVSLCLLFIVCFFSLFFFSQHSKKYLHEIAYDDDMNTFIYLAKEEDDLEFLRDYTKTFVTPIDIENKLFFIAKAGKYYSVAYCDKSEQNTCKLTTTKAVTFAHFDLNEFWPMLSLTGKNTQAITLFDQDNKTPAAAKSFNLYLENGVVSNSIVQYFLQQKDHLNWSFSGLNYRMNTDTNQFVPVSFKGGNFSLSRTSVSPFVAEITVRPEFLYWIQTEAELAKLGVKKPGKIEEYFDNVYLSNQTHKSYIVFRQKDMILWFSEELGFYWLNKKNMQDSNFSELGTFKQCTDNLGLIPNSACNPL
jgi:DNA-binding winged helix-turn-helix (wHTH) protein